MAKKEEVGTPEFGQKIPPEPEVEEPKMEEPTTEETTETLKAQLQELQGKLAETEKLAKGHQEGASRKGKEVEELQAGVVSDIQTLKSQVEIVASMLADVMDRDVEEETPQKRKSDDYIQRFRDVGSEAKKSIEEQTRQRHQALIQETVSVLNKAGKEPSVMDTPEFATAKVLFLEGKTQEGLEEVKRIVGQTPKEEEVKKETEEEMEARIIKKYLAEKGELDSETGKASSVNISEEEIRKNFRENPSDKKAKRDYYDMLRNKEG